VTKNLKNFAKFLEKGMTLRSILVFISARDQRSIVAFLKDAWPEFTSAASLSFDDEGSLGIISPLAFN
jgi:hypothetical protein